MAESVFGPDPLGKIMSLLRDHEVLRMWVGRLADLPDNAIQDEIDRFFLSHEDRWKKWGFVVKWSEKEPRAYEILLVPVTDTSEVLARCPTVQAVDEFVALARHSLVRPS